MPFLARFSSQAAKAWGMTSGARTKLFYVISTTASNVSVNVSTLTGYALGNTDLTITVNSGVILTSTVITTPALVITGSTTGDTITLVNNGYIFGKGGDGGYGGCQGGFGTGVPYGFPGLPGGNAISLSGSSGVLFYLNNSVNISGGGGGGGGGGLGADYYYSFYGTVYAYMGGGGGGGGITNGAGGHGGFGNRGGGAGTAGAGTPPAYTVGTGGSGGSYINTRGAAGAAGGSYGAVGGNAAAGTGAWYRGAGGIGGLAGKAIDLNGNTITYVTTGTINGVVS